MAKYELNKLKDKYADFTFPSFSISINDKKIDREFCQGKLRLELSADYDASSCTIEIYNAFSEKNKTSVNLKDGLDKHFQVGNKINVSIGYLKGGVTEAFVGYIDSVLLDYDKDDGIGIILECLDGKGLMMNSYNSEAKVSLKKNSAAIEDVIKKYNSVINISLKDLDKSDNEKTYFVEQHNESDYQFVTRLAKQIDYCFFIEKGSLICKPFSKLAKEVYFQFDINDYLFSFSMNNSLKDVVSSIIVRGNNEKDPTKPFEAKVETSKNLVDNGKTSLKVSKLISQNVSKNFSNIPINSQEEASALAQSMLNEISYSLYTGKVKIIGIPELLPGKVVEVVGFGKGFDRKYFVSRVIHYIRNNKFTTECELEVNKK